MVIWVHDVKGIHLQKFSGGIATNVLAGAIAIEEALAVVDVDGRGGGVRHGAELGLALEDGLFRIFALGDVDHGALQRLRSSVLTGEERHIFQHPNRRPIALLAQRFVIGEAAQPAHLFQEALALCQAVIASVGIFAQHFFARGVAKYLGHRVIAIEERAFQGGDVDPGKIALEKITVAFFGGADVGFGTLALGDIDQRAFHGLSAVLTVEGDVLQYPYLRTVAPAQ